MAGEPREARRPEAPPELPPLADQLQAARARRHPPGQIEIPRNPRAELLVALAFLVAAVSGVALLIVYIAGGQAQVEGVLLALCLGGIGVGIVLWSQFLMLIREVEEPRHTLASSPAERAASEESREEEAGFTRRRFLLGGLLAALGGLAAALVVPVFSLGPAPGRSLFQTSWRSGSRVVRADGTVIHDADLIPESVLTVFPQGHEGEADAATLIMRLDPTLLRLDQQHMAWAPGGVIAYSKLCTHAGCPVGLYRASQHQLICPCHQSTFDVLDGARPIFGPAARPLPQLPIQRQPDGSFVALSDYPEPVGPSFWDMNG